MTEREKVVAIAKRIATLTEKLVDAGIDAHELTVSEFGLLQALKFHAEAVHGAIRQRMGD